MTWLRAVIAWAWRCGRHHKGTLGFVALTLALLLGVWRVETLAIRNCENVELLKTAERAEAREQYDDLERNAAILKIAVTRELRRIAQEERDATLKRFASHRC